MEKIEIYLDKKIDSKEIYEMAKKEVNKYLENNNLELIKMSKRGKVIYVVVKDKNQNVYGLKVLVYMTSIFNYILHIKIYETAELASKLFTLKELLLFTNVDSYSIDSNLAKVRWKFKEEQIDKLKGINVKAKDKVKTGSIVKFEKSVEFMNGNEQNILKYIGRNKFIPVNAKDESIIYRITNFKRLKYEIINENCK